MFDLKVSALKLEGIYLIEYDKFRDERGYFTEHFRLSDFDKYEFMKGFKVMQTNESFSGKGVFRGMHFQYDAPMGKLVRLISGHMIDFVLDIRKDSKSFGKIIGIELIQQNDKRGEWIWIPPGFAHGCYFLEDSRMEYYCTAEYNKEGEGCISPFADDIDWSICNTSYVKTIDWENIIITDKDRNGITCGEWLESTHNFVN